MDFASPPSEHLGKKDIFQDCYHWWVPNPPFANPGVAEKAPWWSLQSGVAAYRKSLQIPIICPYS